ncbi:MAG TPA: 50S ribosomal protein L32 [Abditibacteriaceae bacterium]|jgi:large subunit ribosomal protein L32
MALPKRRKSHARVRTRRANWKAAPITKTSCPHCAATIVPHRACMSCGYYNGRQILQPRVKNTQLPETE